MTAALARGTSFLLGLGFSLLPAVGPFFALLLLISTRLRLRRLDLIWAGAAIAYTVPAVFHGPPDHAIRPLGQLLAGWLIYRAFAEVRSVRSDLVRPELVGVGLVAGLASVVAVNLLSVDAWNFTTAKTLARAIVWHDSPALFGHTMLALGGLIAIMAPHRAARLAALVLSAFGILVSGSREAAIAWIAIAGIVLLAAPRRPLRIRLLEVGLVTSMVAIAAGLGPVLGWGKVGFLLQPAPLHVDRNLLTGTELPDGDWWDRSWVTVDATRVVLDGQEMNALHVRKAGDEGWLRLQQAVPLQPHTVYTVSAWIARGGIETEPGIQGWGQYRDDGPVRTFVVIGALEDGTWNARVVGPGELVDSGVERTDGPWRRVYATFRYEGPEPLSWFVGLAPDARRESGTASTFAGFQLEEGPLGEYQPGGASVGLPVGVARLPYWEAAWEGIQERPILGWGPDSFPQWFSRVWPDRSRVHVIPAHTHNMFLQAWFDRGLFGLAGLLLVIAALAGPAIVRGDYPLATVIGALCFANLFDATLLYGGVFYPLVAVAGWRSATRARIAEDRRAAGRHLVVRITLSVADATAAAAAFMLALQTARALFPATEGVLGSAPLPSFLLYALALWPALSWREGLYPGYGLTPQHELKKQVVVCSHAALILAAALLVFGARLPVPVPVPVVALAFGLSLIALPLFRATSKRLLLALGLWGRPVVILGAGERTERVARALRRTPLDGLHPVAIFDDDPALRGTEIAGIRVHGPRDAARAFAKSHGIHHAIVTSPSSRSETPEPARRADRTVFRTVQYVPDLGDLPVEDAAASSLDGMLAIEIRNNLALRRNRVAKRAIDLVGVVVAGAVLAPMILALALAVRLDSRGPAFFGHRRIGRDGRPFVTWKFRTMITDAERTLEAHLAEDPELRREWRDTQKLQNDPRVTRVGRFLRRTSLDELPQLLNVLMGQMSLVGPRPIVQSEVEKYGDAFELYASVRPGITGHWQVSGRSDTTYRERVELDTYYVRNWSVWLDVIILVRTFRVVFRRAGAY